MAANSLSFSLCLVVAAMAVPAVAGAGAPVASTTATASTLDGAAAQSDLVLDAARGGFDLGGGLKLSLGIERLVAVNGDLLSRSSMQLLDGGQLATPPGGQAVTPLSVLQNGPGNVFHVAPLPQAFGGTVLQNSLSDQLVQTTTVINASVNSAAILKTMNFQGSLQNALNSSLGGR